MGNSKNWLKARARNKQLIEKAKRIAAGGLISAVIVGPLIYFGAVAVPIELRNAQQAGDGLTQDIAATPEVKISTTLIEFPEEKALKEIKNPKVEFQVEDLPELKKENVAPGTPEITDNDFVETLKNEFKDQNKDVRVKTTIKQIEGQEEKLLVMENLDIDDGPWQVKKKEDADTVARTALRKYLKTNPQEADFDIYKDTSKIKNSKKTYQLVISDIKTNNEKWYVAFQQYKETLPVFDGNLKMVFTERKKLLAITDNLRTNLPETTDFEISNIWATESAKQIFEWDDTEDKIDFVNKGYYKNKPVYKIDVDSHNPLGKYEVFIAGDDGEVKNITGDIRLGNEIKNKFLAQVTEDLPTTPTATTTEEADLPNNYSEEEPYLTPEDLNPNVAQDTELLPDLPDPYPIEENEELISESNIYLKTIKPITDLLIYLEQPSTVELPEEPLSEQPVTTEIAATPQTAATPQAGATPEPEIIILDTLFSQVLGKIYPEYPTQNAVITPFADAYTYYNSEQFTTDNEGFFENKDMNWYSIFLDGPYVTIHDDDATANTDIKDRTPEDPFIWDENSASLEAINAFYHTNKLHEYFKNAHNFDLNKNIPLTVNSELVDQYIDGCGAWFDNSNKTIEMGRGGTSTCPNDLNYALGSDFIYHEYAHFIVEEITHLPNIAGSEAAAMGEGLADYFAATVNDDSEWGEVIAPNNTRNLFNSLNYNSDMVGESHHDGQIFAGALWDLRILIGQEEADKLIFNTLYQDRLHFETFMYGLLIEDDSNNDFSDGTPHMLEIIAAFQRHGIGPGIENFNGLPIDPELWSELLEEEAPTGLESSLTQAFIGTCINDGLTIGVEAGNTCTVTGTYSPFSVSVYTGTLNFGTTTASTQITTSLDTTIRGNGTTVGTLNLGATNGTTRSGVLIVGDELRVRDGGRIDVKSYNNSNRLAVNTATYVYETSTSYAADTFIAMNSYNTSNYLAALDIGHINGSSYGGSDIYVSIGASRYAYSSNLDIRNSSQLRNYGTYFATSSTYVNNARIYAYAGSVITDLRSTSTFTNGGTVYCYDSFDIDNTMTFSGTTSSYFYDLTGCDFTPTTANFTGTTRYITGGGTGLNSGTINFEDTAYLQATTGTFAPSIATWTDTSRAWVYNLATAQPTTSTFNGSSYLDLDAGTFAGTPTFNATSYADLDGGSFNPGTATFNTSAYVDINGTAYYSPATSHFNSSASMRHRAVGTASDGNVNMNGSSRLYYYGGTSNFGVVSVDGAAIIYAHGGTLTSSVINIFGTSGRLDKTYYSIGNTGDGAVTVGNLTLDESGRVTHNRATGTVTINTRLWIDEDAYYSQSSGTTNSSTLTQVLGGADGTITAIADLGGLTLVTSANHGLANGDVVTISETTNYNGAWTISSVSTNNFYISTSGYAGESSGLWTTPNGMLQVTGGSFNSTTLEVDEKGWIDQNGGTITTSALLELISDGSLYDNDGGTATFNGISMINNSEIQNDGTINIKSSGVLMEDTSLLTNDYTSGGTATINMNEASVGHHIWKMVSSSDVVNNSGGTITAQTGSTYGDDLQVFDTTTFTNRGSVTFDDVYIGMDDLDNPQEGGLFNNAYTGGPAYVDIYGDLEIFRGSFVNASDRPAAYGAQVRGNVDVTGYYNVSFCDISVFQNQGHMWVWGNTTMGTSNATPSYSCSRIQTIDSSTFTDNVLMIDGDVIVSEDYTEIYGTGGLDINGSLDMTAQNSYIKVESAQIFQTTTIAYDGETSDFSIGDTLNIGGHLVKLVGLTDSGNFGTITVNHYPTFTFADNDTITGNYAGFAYVNEPTGVTYGSFDFNAGFLNVQNDLILNGSGGTAPYIENEGSVYIGPFGSSSFQLNGNSYLDNEESDISEMIFNERTSAFSEGEIITGQDSGATGSILYHSYLDEQAVGALLIADPFDKFEAGETITGNMGGIAKVYLAANNHKYTNATVHVDTADPSDQNRGKLTVYNTAAVYNKGTINANVLWVGASPSTEGGTFQNNESGNVSITSTGSLAAQFFRANAFNHSSSGTFTVAGEFAVDGISGDKTTYDNYNDATVGNINIGDFGQLDVEAGFTGTLDYYSESQTFEGLERINGLSSGASGVIEYIIDNGTTGTFYLRDMSGTFQVGEIINGAYTGVAKVESLETRDVFTATGASKIWDDIANPEIAANSGVLSVKEKATFDATGGSISQGSSSITGGEIANYGTILTDYLTMYESSVFNNYSTGILTSYNTVELAYDYSANDYIRDFDNMGDFNAVDVNIFGDNADMINEAYVTADMDFTGDLDIIGGKFTNEAGNLGVDVDGITTVGYQTSNALPGALYNYDEFWTNKLFIDSGYAINGQSGTDAIMNVESATGTDDMEVKSAHDAGSPRPGTYINYEGDTLVAGQVHVHGTYFESAADTEAQLHNGHNVQLGDTADFVADEIYVEQLAWLQNYADLDVGNKFWTGDNVYYKTLDNEGTGDWDVNGTGDLWLYNNTTLTNETPAAAGQGNITTTGTMKVFEDAEDTIIYNHGELFPTKLWNGDIAVYKGGDIINYANGDINVTSTASDAGNVYYGVIALQDDSDGFDVAGKMTVTGAAFLNPGYIVANDTYNVEIPTTTFGELEVGTHGFVLMGQSVEIDDSGGQTGDLTITGTGNNSGRYTQDFYGTDPVNDYAELKVDGQLRINNYGTLTNNAHENPAPMLNHHWSSGGVQVIGLATIEATGRILSDTTSQFNFQGGVTTAGTIEADDHIKSTTYTQTGGTSTFGLETNVGLVYLTDKLTVSDGIFKSYNYGDNVDPVGAPLIDNGFSDIEITGATTEAYFENDDGLSGLDCFNDVHGYFDILGGSHAYINCETASAMVVHAGSPGGTTLVEGNSTLYINTNLETDDMIVGGTGYGIVTHDIASPISISESISNIVDAGGGESTVTSPNHLVSGDQVTINNTTNYNGTYYVLSANTTSFKISISGFAPETSGDWVQTTISSTANSVFDLHVNNDLTINSNGLFDVSRKSNHPTTYTVAGPYGGTHAGMGQYSAGIVKEYGKSTSYFDTTLYNTTHPDFGVTGVLFNGLSPVHEGKGGGKMKIYVDGNLTNNGYIQANGESGDDYADETSGSGGSIMIWAGNIVDGVMSGSGVIEAKGGTTTSTTTGYAGGGGRIYIDYFDKSGYTGDVTSEGGTAQRSSVLYSAAPGSVFYRWRDPWENQRRGTLVIKGNDTADINLDLTGIQVYTDSFQFPDNSNAGPSGLGDEPAASVEVDSLQIEDQAAFWPTTTCAAGCTKVQQCITETTGSTFYNDGSTQIEYNSEHTPGPSDQTDICYMTPDPTTGLVINDSGPGTSSGTIQPSNKTATATIYDITPDVNATHHDGKLDSGATGDTDGATAMQIQVANTLTELWMDDTANYVCDISDYLLIFTVNNSSVLPSDVIIQDYMCTLAGNTSYYWRMRLKDNEAAMPGWGMWSQTGTFDVGEGGTIAVTSCDSADLNYNLQGTNFTIGQTLTSSTSGGTATIIADVDNGDNGILTITSIAGNFYNGDTITDGGGGSATATSDLLYKFGVGTYDSSLGDNFDNDKCSFASEATVKMDIKVKKDGLLTHSTTPAAQIIDMIATEDDPLTGLDGLNDSFEETNEVGFYLDNVSEYDPPNLLFGEFDIGLYNGADSYIDYYSQLPTSITTILTSQGPYSNEIFDMWLGVFINGLIPHGSDPVGNLPTNDCGVFPNDEACISLTGVYDAIVTYTISTSP